MDIYARLVDEFSKITHLKEWNEVQTLFRQVALGRPAHWLLPLRACEAAGGTVEQAIPAILAVACSHIGIVLVDDMLDADSRGAHLKVGEPAAANMASALQSAALAAISVCNISLDAKLRSMECVNEIFLATTIGQYWDVNSIVEDEDSYWKIAKAKSSPFFGASLQLGALMGGASVKLSEQFKELGGLYGEMIQLHDDINDTLTVPAKPDWETDRTPLPILFAKLVDHPLRARFEELRPNARSSPKILKEAQEILIRCGAISYCVYQLMNRYETVKNMLVELEHLDTLCKGECKRYEILNEVFEDVLRPVFLIFEKLDKVIGSEVQTGVA